jgi:hypothetical protein
MRILPVIACVSFLLFTLSAPVFGQDAPSWELGPTMSMIRLARFDRNHVFGFGGRAVWNFSSVLGTELQFARMSRNESFVPANQQFWKTHHQLIASLKATLRQANVLKLHPFALAGVGGRRDTTKVTYGGASPRTFTDRQNSIALRLGGGVEFIPHTRVSIRLDASNLASREAATGGYNAYPAQWWNRLDVGVSTMVRLGGIKDRQ